MKATSLLTRWFVSFGLLILLGLLAAACGSDPTATPTPRPTPTPQPQATPTPEISVARADFLALVERARASNHVVRVALAGKPPEMIRAWEAAFEERFGFSLILENEPGNASRDMPVKVERAAESGQGAVDANLFGDIKTVYPLYEKDLLALPPWEALYTEWPVLEKLRNEVPEWGGGPAGTTIRDYCVQNSHAIWTVNYSTQRVTPEELADLTWDELTTEKWRGRVGLDGRALGVYLFPLAPGWSPERMEAWAHNMGANGAKFTSGGSTGQNQALLQGEVDIVLASPPMADITAGAPVAFTTAEFLVGANPRGSCLPKFTVNDPDMATLYWAWNIIEGSVLEGQTTGVGGWLHPELADDFPLMSQLKAQGVTPDKFVKPSSLEESEMIETWRQMAIDAMLEGARTDTMVPVP